MAHDGLSASAGTPPRADSSEIASLVNAATAGDRNAWDALVNRFAATVWAVARGHRLSAADAADVSQTTWLRLVENLHRIREPERVGAWLAVTARRESLRVLRIGARQTTTGHDFDVLPDPAPATPPDHVVATREWASVVSDLVAQLPTRSQLLLRLLSADSPLSYRDISEALDMPIGSIGPTAPALSSSSSGWRSRPGSSPRTSSFDGGASAPSGPDRAVTGCRDLWPGCLYQILQSGLLGCRTCGVRGAGLVVPRDRSAGDPIASYPGRPCTRPAISDCVLCSLDSPPPWRGGPTWCT